MIGLQIPWYASTSNPGYVQLAGDLAGSATAPTVAKVNGASVPAAGALTTGQALIVSGSSALGYGTDFGANSLTTTGNYLAGATPRSTVGNLQLPNATTMIAFRKADNSADINALSSDSSNRTTINGGAASDFRIGTASSALAWQFQNQQCLSGSGFSATVYGQATGASNGNTVTYAGQTGASGAFTGGNANLRGGARGQAGSVEGGAQLVCGTSDIMFQAIELVSGQLITAINRKTTVTTTQLPTNTGDGVTYVANAATAPTASPVSGGLFYASAGAGHWYGTSGTNTTFGPADPHCPSCSHDFGTEHKNDAWGSHVAMCWVCMLETLEAAGIKVSQFAHIRKVGKASKPPPETPEPEVKHTPWFAAA